MCIFASKNQIDKLQNNEKTNLFTPDDVAHDDDGPVQVASVVARQW